MRVAIVADDLTGAMDAAAPFAARGLATRVFPEIDLDDGPRALEAEVVAVNTESRHLRPEQAAAAVAAVILRLAVGRPQILLKKIDSTLRGNVAAEIAAAIEASGRRRALVTPAMPAQGRTLRGGRLYVHGIPLAHTAIGKDRLSPPPLAPLIELLREAIPAMTWAGLAADAEDLPRASIVFDAVSEGDMALIAARIMDAKDPVLACGSGGLGRSLAERCGNAARPPAGRAAWGPLLYVVGSRTPQAAAQVAALEERAGGAVFEVAADGTAVCPPDARVIVLRPARKDGDAAQMASALAEAASRTIEAVSPAAIVMTGGDTALAVLRRLSVRSIDVADELLPGIALGSVMVGGRQLLAVTKAGGFGDADVFVDIRDRLMTEGR